MNGNNRPSGVAKLTSVLRRNIWIFPTLSLITLVIGHWCKESCSLLQGDILGIDLNIFGAVFYLILLATALLQLGKRLYDPAKKAIAVFTSIGAGAEIIFVKFQVQNSVYCAKCLISGLFLLMMFGLASRSLKKWMVVALIVAGALFTSFVFNGAIVPSFAAGPGYPEFGNPKAGTEVVFYSDYFCPACRQVDNQVNAALRRLRNKVRIRLIDVPVHPGSAEYDKIFVYVWLKYGSNLDTMLKAREILFKAAGDNLAPAQAISALKNAGISLSADEKAAKDIFLLYYTPLMKTDKLNATPTLVVVNGSERKKYVGAKEITQALGELSRNK